jgi:hypothetical protein
MRVHRRFSCANAFGANLGELTMRQPLLLAIFVLPILTAPALADCGEEIRAAMVRAVTSGPYHLETVVTLQGVVSESVVDIVPGKAMRALGSSGGLRHETVVIGEQGWMNTDGTWQEMPAEMAADAVAALKSATGSPDALGKISGESCLGASVSDGREVLTYSYDITSNGIISHSDVLVDSGTGLPIRTEMQTNISGSNGTIVSTYTYDAAITVEAPM